MVDRRWLAVLALATGCRQLLGFDDPAVVRDAPGAGSDAMIDAYIPDAGPCQTLGAECVGPVLRACTTIGLPPLDTSCAWGCLAAPDAHCGKLAPAGGIAKAEDLDVDPMIQDVTLAGATVNTDNGQIDGVRDPGGGVRSGIGFEQRANGGVFRFGALTVTGTLIVVGQRAAVFVALREVSVGGIVDLTGGCDQSVAGPGGGPGGQNQMKGANGVGSSLGGGMQGGVGAPGISGGGGGGRGDNGGGGGAPGTSPLAMGGLSSGDAAITSLSGGGGGGGGGGGNGGRGGGGGGALQIAANGVLTVGGVVHGGGCGGAAGLQSGGGGGAGGTILLEAPTVVIGATAILAANGGGGGGGGGTRGENAAASATRAAGGNGANNGTGGRGGAGATAGGEAGAPGTTNGGGGGGAVGRIRLNTRSGTPGVDGAAVVSPAASAGAATVQ